MRVRTIDSCRALVPVFILVAILTAHSALPLLTPDAVAGTIQITEDARPLGPGEIFEREISEGETHYYRLALAEGQYLHASVKGLEIDIQVTLHEPGGEKIFERGRNHPLRPEVIAALARQSGDHSLTVTALGKQGRRGRYTIKIEELRSALPEDTYRVAAERAMAEGEELAKQHTEQPLRKALEKFEESRANWRSISDRQGEATALNFIGLLNRRLGQSRRAIDCYNQALSLSRAEGDRLGEGETLNNLGTAHYALGQLQQALDLFNQALPVLREIGDRRGEVSTLNNLGSIYWATGEALLSLDYYNASIPLRRELRDVNGEARTLNNLGTAYAVLGEPQKALEFYLKSLLLWRETGDLRGEATTLGNIGLIYFDLGEPDKTLDYNKQYLLLSRGSGYRAGEAYALRNMGLAHSILGDYPKALDLFRQALAIFREVEDRRGEANVLYHMGNSYGGLGKHQESLDSTSRSLTAYKAMGDRRGEAHATTGIARAHGLLDELDKSLEHYREALALYKSLKHPGGEANALLNIARIDLRLGGYQRSRKSIEAALEIVESVRARVAAEDLRASYSATNRDYYEFYIDLLMEMHRRRPSEGYDNLALQASERGRARSLLDTLAESRAELRQGIDPAILNREHAVRRQLNAKDSYRIRLLAGKHSSEQVTSVEKQLSELQAEYHDLQARIRDTSPRYAALTQPATLDIKGIQRQVLDADTLLLEYALGKERSFVWVVTADSIDSFELPGHTDIEAAAHRARELLIVSHRRQHKRESELALAELSRMLIAPVADRLKGRKRLLIVADGVLHYIPFAALTLPETGPRADTTTRIGEISALPGPRGSALYVPLIVDYEVISLPSISVLSVLRRDIANRKSAGKQVAIFADPVFDQFDQRLRKTRSNRAPEMKLITSDGEQVISSDLPELARKAGLTSLERLPFSGLEAEAILSLVEETDSLKALGFNASLANAISPELADYRIVHFATHGLINNQRPELSGLVLSLFDERGRSQNGFLRANDIYNLRLGAELVVLSSCSTALGKQVRGEGLLGLVRGFIYAGAPRVVASLWDVKDDATAELMRIFYDKMLKEGLRPAAALRNAQIEMLSQPRWQAPYYWAGFVLQGEWR